MVDSFSFEDEKTKLAYQLSGGNLKKLNLSCSFVDDRPFVILEQPTNALDIVSQKNLWQFLKKKKKQGTTIILVS